MELGNCQREYISFSHHCRLSGSRTRSMDAKNVFCNLELELGWGLPEEYHCKVSGDWVQAYLEPWKFHNFTTWSTERERTKGKKLDYIDSMCFILMLSPLFLFTVWLWEPQHWGGWWWWRRWTLYVVWKPQPDTSVRVSYSVLLQLQYSGAVLQSLQPGSVPCFHRSGCSEFQEFQSKDTIVQDRLLL